VKAFAPTTTRRARAGLSILLGILIMCSAALSGAVPATPAYACLNAITVTNGSDSGTGSLRDAVANLCGGGTITFNPGVTTVTLTSGHLSINKDLTIDGGNMGVIVERDANATSDFGIFYITGSSTDVTLDSLTVRNGNTASSGGGIYNEGTLTVNNSTLSGNAATNGGGISNFDGTLTVTVSTISGNTAINGGGISNFDGTLTVSNSTLSGNAAAVGGGISNTGTLTVNNSTLSGNAATNGGGISNTGTLTVNNSTLSGNAATNGGGIYNFDGTLTVTVSTISDNTATNGGGIYNFSTLEVYNGPRKLHSESGSFRTYHDQQKGLQFNPQSAGRPGDFA
jgi:hypothetical protein